VWLSKNDFPIASKYKNFYFNIQVLSEIFAFFISPLAVKLALIISYTSS